MVTEGGAFLFEGLEDLGRRRSQIREVRGLMVGVELEADADRKTRGAAERKNPTCAVCWVP